MICINFYTIDMNSGYMKQYLGHVKVKNAMILEVAN